LQPAVSAQANAAASAHFPGTMVVKTRSPTTFAPMPAS
jgi:hypothetical protein